MEIEISLENVHNRLQVKWTPWLDHVCDLYKAKRCGSHEADWSIAEEGAAENVLVNKEISVETATRILVTLVRVTLGQQVVGLASHSLANRNVEGTLGETENHGGGSTLHIEPACSSFQTCSFRRRNVELSGGHLKRSVADLAARRTSQNALCTFHFRLKASASHVNVAVGFGGSRQPTTSRVFHALVPILVTFRITALHPRTAR